MVRTQLFHCRGPGSIPGWGTEILKAARCSQNKFLKKKEKKKKRERKKTVGRYKNKKDSHGSAAHGLRAQPDLRSLSPLYPALPGRHGGGPPLHLG